MFNGWSDIISNTPEKVPLWDNGNIYWALILKRESLKSGWKKVKKKGLSLRRRQKKKELEWENSIHRKCCITRSLPRIDRYFMGLLKKYRVRDWRNHCRADVLTQKFCFASWVVNIYRFGLEIWSAYLHLNSWLIAKFFQRIKSSFRMRLGRGTKLWHKPMETLYMRTYGFSDFHSSFSYRDSPKPVNNLLHAESISCLFTSTPMPMNVPRRCVSLCC